MTVEADLISYMLTLTAITDLVSDRIQPVSRVQGDPLPGITVTRISGGPLYADDGEVGIADMRVQVDCWGAQYRDAKGLAEVVVEALSAVRDVEQGGTSFTYIMLDNEQDLREGGGNAPEYLFRTSLDFTILSQEV